VKVIPIIAIILVSAVAASSASAHPAPRCRTLHLHGAYVESVCLAPCPSLSPALARRFHRKPGPQTGLCERVHVGYSPKLRHQFAVYANHSNFNINCESEDTISAQRVYPGGPFRVGFNLWGVCSQSPAGLGVQAESWMTYSRKGDSSQLSFPSNYEYQTVNPFVYLAEGWHVEQGWTIFGGPAYESWSWTIQANGGGSCVPNAYSLTGILDCSSNVNWYA
jgi:hypothetical protein